MFKIATTARLKLGATGSIECCSQECQEDCPDYEDCPQFLITAEKIDKECVGLSRKEFDEESEAWKAWDALLTKSWLPLDVTCESKDGSE